LPRQLHIDFTCAGPCRAGSFCRDLYPTDHNRSCSVYSDGWEPDSQSLESKEIMPTYNMPTLPQVAKTILGRTCGGMHFEAKCREGSYCPTPHEIHRCPDGHVCRLGADTPHECWFGCHGKGDDAGYGVGDRSVTPTELVLIISLILCVAGGLWAACSAVV
jgi:hypothetical protein